MGASPGDDGAQFAVVVSNGVGTGMATSLLHVSPWPGVVVEDGDFALDCRRLDTSTSGETQVTPVLEQAGRWFAPQRWQTLCAPVWFTAQHASHTADAFERIAGQACPDFSAGAPPIRFGFVSGVDIPPGRPPAPSSKASTTGA